SIATMTQCRGIVRCGVGFDNVDSQAAGRRGIVVCNVPDYGTEEVADHALMLLLASARRLLACHQAIRAGIWSKDNYEGAPRLRLGGLYEALESGQVQYAALDVVEREPLDDERIRKHPRVLLTPHAAYYSVESFSEMRTKGALEARRMLLGEPVRNPVNLHC